MFRGTGLLFTAILTVFYRHRTLRMPDWVGVIVTIVGITAVGLSAVLYKSDNSSTIAKTPIELQILGMGLMLVGQGLQAMAIVLMEVFMHDVDALPTEIIAFEGCWGLFLSSFVAMPIANILPEGAGEGLFEQSLETFLMLGRSGKIIGLSIGYCVAVAGLNLTGMMVVSFSSAIQRNICEALRSFWVWVLSVAVYYIWPDSGAGEPLSMMSIAQAGGFLISMAGSFIYNRVVQLPCGAAEPLEENKHDNVTSLANSLESDG
jgi:hypothetical protein